MRYFRSNDHLEGVGNAKQDLEIAPESNTEHGVAAVGLRCGFATTTHLQLPVEVVGEGSIAQRLTQKMSD